MKLDPIGKLFGDSSRLFGERFGEVVGIFAVPAAFMAIADIILLYPSPLAKGLGEIVSLLGAIASLLAGIALIAAIGRRINFHDAYRTGFHLFWPLIWISVLVFFVVAGGFVFLIVPGIFLVVVLSFTNYVFVLENKHGLAALLASREYTRGYWWAVFGRALLLFALFTIVVALIDAPFAALGLKAIGSIVYALLLIVFVPFSVCYTFSIYENLRRLKPNALEALSKTTGTFFKICMAAGLVFVAIFIIATAIFGLSQVKSMPGTGPGGASANSAQTH